MTDLIAIAGVQELTIATVQGSFEETLGINDRTHLQFAERLKDITYAESLYELIHASIALGRQAQRPSTAGE